jgi:hypothetical protein
MKKKQKRYITLDGVIFKKSKKKIGVNKFMAELTEFLESRGMKALIGIGSGNKNIIYHAYALNHIEKLATATTISKDSTKAAEHLVGVRNTVNKILKEVKDSNEKPEQDTTEQ